jgi:SPP1 gp7 family putative phage head morphogenesis protein
MTKTLKTLRPIHSNKGVEAKYRKKLDRLVQDMSASTIYWLSAQYKQSPPLMASDASPVEGAKKRLKKLKAFWLLKFADAYAIWFVESAFKASNNAFNNALAEEGIAVQKQWTPAMKDALKASVAENVALIKSIPEQYFKNIEGIVMRNYIKGGDLKSMADEIQAQYPVTRRRAAFIARDQNNKANAAVNQTRSLEMGFEEAIWLHSHGGKEPRPDHVAADGKRYKIKEGCLISGEYIQPGELINCRCVSRVVLPF